MTSDGPFLSCTLAVLLVSLLAIVVALPLHVPIEDVNSSECVTVHATTHDMAGVSDELTNLLDPRWAKQLSLSVSLIENKRGKKKVQLLKTQHTSSVSRINSYVRSDAYAVWLCQEEEDSVKDKKVQVVYLKSHNERKQHIENGHSVLYIILSSDAVREMSGNGKLSLSLVCNSQLPLCIDIVYNSSTDVMATVQHRAVYRRSVKLHKFTSDNFDDQTPGGGNTHSKIIVLGLVITVLSVVVLVTSVALCTGRSGTYDSTQQPKSSGIHQSEVAEQPVTEVTIQVAPTNQETVPISDVHTANSVAMKPKEDLEASTKSTLSSTSPRLPSVGEEDKTDRARTLSARSFDPLPEIPKLDLAEEGKPREKAENNELKDEDDAGYAYARVGGADVGIREGDSDREDDDDDDKANVGEDGGEGKPPPYGKVSRHVAPAKKKHEYEEYAEVKEVVRGPPVLGRRDRSHTDPIDPGRSIESPSHRDRRALTHTEVPLPALPSVRDNIEETYDSIPEDMKTESTVPPPMLDMPLTNPNKTRRERLYESMDEFEDTYESVPDNIKPDTPSSFSPAVSTPSPTKPPFAPLPPTSPVPVKTKANKKESAISAAEKVSKSEGEKKALEKTLSASQTEVESKRRFSFFNRKKATSVSAVTKPKKEEKEHHHKGGGTHHAPQQPLPNLPHSPMAPPTSPPPLPPIPVPDNDLDDIMYDTPQLDFMQDTLHYPPDPQPNSPSKIPDSTKTKTQSLPASMRSSSLSASILHGPRVNIPLPRVPEDSGEGVVTVVHQRTLELDDVEEPYDTVKIGANSEEPYDTVKVGSEEGDLDDPNYDTVNAEDVLKAAEHSEQDRDPGYDRVRTGFEENGVKSVSDTMPERDVNNYAKVTRSMSPDERKPDHDEEGYAVVPQVVKMRKRAMSASQGTPQEPKLEGILQGPREPSPDHYDSIDERHQREASQFVPDEPYASVDMSKKRSLDVQSMARHEKSSSPIPPPLPPVGDLGDLTEFHSPPVPTQSVDVLELINPARNSLKLLGNDDPSYSRVKSKDHPYAELDLGFGNGEVGKLIDDRQEHKVKSNIQSEPSQDVYDSLDPKEDTNGASEAEVNTMYDSLEPQQNYLNGVSPEDMEDEVRYEEIDEDQRRKLQLRQHSSHQF